MGDFYPALAVLVADLLAGIVAVLVAGLLSVCGVLRWEMVTTKKSLVKRTHREETLKKKVSSQ